jgi:hypothetical protein
VLFSEDWDSQGTFLRRQLRDKGMAQTLVQPDLLVYLADCTGPGPAWDEMILHEGKAFPMAAALVDTDGQITFARFYPYEQGSVQATLRELLLTGDPSYVRKPADQLFREPEFIALAVTIVLFVLVIPGGLLLRLLFSYSGPFVRKLFWASLVLTPVLGIVFFVLAADELQKKSGKGGRQTH